ncbi:MAG: DUF1127 domain-containing protein [Pseudomonadota bacterium]
MAYYTSVISNGASAPSVASYIKSIRDAYVVWNTRRVTRDQLAKLSLRELDDIGLTLADVDAITHRV